jgi:hypothetical protein
MSRRKKAQKIPEKKPTRYPVETIVLVVLVVLVLGVCLFLMWRRSLEWSRFEISGGGFVVELPPGEVSGPKTREMTTKFGSVKPTFAVCQLKSGEAYTILFFDAPMERLRDADAKTHLEEFALGMLREVPRGVVKSKTDRDFQGFPGKELVIESPDLEGKGVYWLLLIGRRWVSLSVGGPEVRTDNERVVQFFKSFQITDQQLIEQGKKDLQVMRSAGAP